MTVCYCIYMFRSFVVFQSGFNIFLEEWGIVGKFIPIHIIVVA